MFKQLAVASLGALFSVSLLASESPSQEEDGGENELESEFRFSLGAMVMTEQSLYVGGEDKTQVLPMVRIRWGRFFFDGPNIGANLYADGAWRMAASISLDGIGDDDWDKSAELADMGKLDNAVMGQFEIGRRADWGELNLTLGADVSGTHDGYKAEMYYTYPFMYSGWIIEPQVGVEWNSEEINQHFFGVRADQAKIGRPMYTPDGGLNYGVGVNAIYPFKEHHSIMLRTEYRTYSDEVTDSPIVNSSSNASVSLGYVYRF